MRGCGAIIVGILLGAWLCLLLDTIRVVFVAVTR